MAISGQRVNDKPGVVTVLWFGAIKFPVSRSLSLYNFINLTCWGLHSAQGWTRSEETIFSFAKNNIGTVSDQHIDIVTFYWATTSLDVTWHTFNIIGRISKYRPKPKSTTSHPAVAVHLSIQQEFRGKTVAAACPTPQTPEPGNVAEMIQVVIYVRLCIWSNAHYSCNIQSLSRVTEIRGFNYGF